MSPDPSHLTMVDKLSVERRSWNMRQIRSKDTKPEMVVRRLVHSMGYRFRLHRKDLPGKPDLVFGPRRKVIFVHGCFWHQHGIPECRISRVPKSRKDYWEEKLANNFARDRDHQQKLEQQGWEVLTVWECQVKDTGKLGRRISAFLSSNRHEKG